MRRHRRLHDIRPRGVFALSSIALPAIALAAVVLSSPALAAGAGSVANWWDPIVNLLSLIQDGIGKIGALVIGLGVVVIGLWAGFSGRMDWMRVGYMLVAGILIFSGPAIATALFGSGG